MSDLAATNCGCECGGNDSSWNMSNNNWIWIILLLSCFGGSSMWNRSNDGCGCNNWIWIILLLSCCSGDNNGCGCF